MAVLFYYYDANKSNFKILTVLSKKIPKVFHLDQELRPVHFTHFPGKVKTLYLD